MQVKDAVVLVTGANRGIGAEFVAQLKERGAAKIYAASRSASAVDLDGVEPIQLDITDPSQVEAAAAAAGDIQVLINNAGISTGASVVAWSLTDSARLELAAQGTHVIGVYMGLVDTDMTAGVDAPKLSPRTLAAAGLDAIESGLDEVLADDWARFVKSGLALGPSQRYEQLFSALAGN